MRLVFLKQQKGNIQGLRRTKFAKFSRGCVTKILQLNDSLASFIHFRLLGKKQRAVFHFLFRTLILQKQPPEVLCKKGVLKNFAEFSGKHLYRSLFFIKVTGLRFNFILCNEKLSLRSESFELAIFFKLSQHFSRQCNILILFFCYLLLSFLRQIVSKFLFCSIFS